MNNKKIDQKRLIKEIYKKNTILKDICEEIFKKYPQPDKMNVGDYVYFVFSSNIVYRTKDLLVLNKKLIEEKNNFDSSMYLLSRSIIEDFFYLSYILLEPDNIKSRLDALTCCNARSDVKHFTSLVQLADKKKFDFNEDPEHILSLSGIEKKIAEHESYIKKHTENNENKDFLNEINIFEHVEQVCQRYDKIKEINSIKKDAQAESLEFLYNFIYRFQSMSVHQNLRDKEKVFSMYLNKKTTPNNMAILSLILNILEKVIKLK